MPYVGAYPAYGSWYNTMIQNMCSMFRYFGFKYFLFCLIQTFGNQTYLQTYLSFLIREINFLVIYLYIFPKR